MIENACGQFTIESLNVNVSHHFHSKWIVFQVSLSPLQDDVVVLHVTGDHASMLDISLKTEFITMLSKKTEERTNRKLRLEFMET